MTRAEGNLKEEKEELALRDYGLDPVMTSHYV